MKTQKSIQCIIPLTMAYMSVMIFSDLLVYKNIEMGYGYTTGATFVFPLWFILNDIVAEVYGPKVCWKMIWTGYIIQLFFNSLVYIVIHLPSPPGWCSQESFNLILGHLIWIELSTLIIYFISINVNIRLLTKWKILTRGKYFWLRSVGSSSIGEAIYSSLNIWLVLYGHLELSRLPQLIFWSFFLKISYTVILAYPATVVVKIIKKIDGDDLNDLEFNPFINQEMDALTNAEPSVQ